MISNKAQAKIDHATTYVVPNTMCKYGHAGPRYTSSGECVECRRLKAKGKHPAQTWAHINIKVHVDDVYSLVHMAAAMRTARGES